ncbi:MAG: hypothetical protein SOX69_02535 [Oscillospiraceae bacterium]|nr:hypothetical protein [Oscillospiraceae bacterium]
MAIEKCGAVCYNDTEWGGDAASADGACVFRMRAAAARGKVGRPKK